MKRKIQTFMIAVLLALGSHGQPFEPVITTDSTSWDIAWKELFGNIMGNLYTVGNQDTLYHELYFQNPFPNAEYVGKIREEVNTGQIWYTPPGSAVEYLIMNLSLTIGETFQLPVFNTTIPIEVVDVYYIDQRKYIEFDFQTEWNEPLRFIEGVGRNIAMHHFWFGDFTYVACKYNAGELVYVNNNPNFIECELNTLSISEKHIEEIMVYPNPCKDILYIQINSSLQTQSELHIIDFTGRIIKNIQLSGFNHKIDLRGLKKGIHFIRITNGNLIFNHTLLLTH